MRPPAAFALFSLALLLAGCFAPAQVQPLAAKETAAGNSSGWIFDGDRVYWTANNYTISASPHTSRGLTHTQYINFSSTNQENFMGNFSFVFGQPITDGRAYYWRNFSHDVQVPVTIRQNFSQVFYNVTSNASTTLPCEVGDVQNAIKRRITQNNGTITQTVVCFNSFSANGSTYTAFFQLNGTVYVTQQQSFYDWDDISANFHKTTIGNSTIFTYYNVQVNNGDNHQVKFTYQTKVNMSGKYDIYIHRGSPQEVAQGLAQIYLHLDPWFNSSYANRFLINCSLGTTGAPVGVNNSNGFTLGGYTQFVFTTCAPELYLYYNNYSDYVIANNTTQFNMDVKQGNVSSFNAAAMYASMGSVSIYHLNNARDSATSNHMALQAGIVTYGANTTQCKFGSCAQFSNGGWLANTTAKGNFGANLSSTVMFWAWRYNLTQATDHQGLYSLGYWPGSGTAQAKCLRWDNTAGSIIQNDWVYASSPPLSYNVTGLNFYTSTYNFTDTTAYCTANSTVCASATYDHGDAAGLIRIGKGNYNVQSSFANGSLAAFSEVWIFNKTQSDGFISTVYNNGVGTPGYGDLGVSEAQSSNASNASNSSFYNGTGNWPINCADNATVSANYNLLGNNITVNATAGTWTINASVTNFTWLMQTRPASGACWIIVDRPNGGMMTRGQ